MNHERTFGDLPFAQFSRGAAGDDQSSALAPYFGSVVPVWSRSLLFSMQTYSISSQPGRK